MKSLFCIVVISMVAVTPVFGQEATPGADYFVEAVVDNPTPFVGQQVTYTFRLYHTTSLEETFYQRPMFKGFTLVESTDDSQRGLPTRISNQIVDDRQYTVSEWDTIVFPTRVGDIEIDPSLFVLRETVFRDEQQQSTNPVQVQVQPLPDGAPAEFNGAVGRFEMQAVLDRASAVLGEPLTLRLTITGSGNFDQLAPPELPIPAGWRVYENRARQSTGVAGGLLVGEKTFEWLIVPNETGTQTLPAASLTFFDPETLAYRSVSTSPVTLEIFPAEGESPQLPSLLDESFASGQSPQPLRLIPAAMQATDLYPGIGFWLLWVLPPAVAVLSWAWAGHQRHMRVDRVKIRQSKALRRARAHLQNTSNLRSNDGCRVISEAICLYFADKLDTVSTGLTQTDVEQTMETREIPNSLRQRVVTCLELADEGQYAPVDAVDIQTLHQVTLDALTALDERWDAE